MGNFCKGCLSRKQDVLLLLIVGLQYTGKTEIAHKICHLVRNDYLQTKGCRIFNTSIEHSSVQIKEIGGAPEFVDIWKYYFLDVHGIIFVVDSSNINNICQSYKVFNNLMAHDFLIGKPFLIIANKQDLPGSTDCVDICEYLDVEFLANKYRNPCMVEPCGNWDVSSNEYDGLLRGINWIVRTIQINKQFLINRINFHRLMIEESHKLFESHRPCTGVRRKKSRFSLRDKRPKTAPAVYLAWMNTTAYNNPLGRNSPVRDRIEETINAGGKYLESPENQTHEVLPTTTGQMPNRTENTLSIKDDTQTLAILTNQNNEELTVEDLSLSLHSADTNKTERKV
ncbi:ADP-ribosylation factor-like protein 13B isoform X2 [Wyeomyia smithii]|uniref:ADP-ribosylation factor-like protein 13B isoform X2 n=1 Tax=Wyeomyia smithii TaxID=174621 RepID=UPI0024681F36|nr:ADP-ribosylation factor-like protein 13B isoform X2 [Wyeomyia smithii]